MNIDRELIFEKNIGVESIWSIIHKKLIRPADVDTLLADYSKAKKNLNWKPKISFDELVKNMVEGDLETISNKY